LPVRLQPILRRLAVQFSDITFLCHHMGYPVVDEGPDGPALRAILASAVRPNIHIKLSGFHYAAPVGWEYPRTPSRYIVEALYDQFGPERLYWGSDYPVVRWAMTYRQALEIIRTHCSAFIPPPDMERILGSSLFDLLQRHGPR